MRQAFRHVHFQGMGKSEPAGGKKLVAGLQEMPQGLAAGEGLRACQHRGTS